MTRLRGPMLHALRKPARRLSRWSRKRKLQTLLAIIEPGARVLLVGISPEEGIGTESLLEGDRVARRGWIHTTPNKRFPIEVHTGVPMLHWLPRAARERAFSFLGIA